MRYTLLSIITIFFLTVSCEKDCVETTGKTITMEVELTSFVKVIADYGIELHVAEGSSQKVQVTTGENRLDNVHFELQDQTLRITYNGGCIFSPSNDPVKVYVTSPNLTMVRNSSEYTCYSEGVLHYPDLLLIVEDFQSDYANIGNFDFKVQNQSLSVVSNGLANIKISGTTNFFNIGYYSGVGKLDAKNLIANDIQVYHRGENNLEIYPLQSLKGDIYSIGNLISYHVPPVVEIEQHYTGGLIFR